MWETEGRRGRERYDDGDETGIIETDSVGEVMQPPASGSVIQLHTSHAFTPVIQD